MWSCVCPKYSMTACKLMEESAIMGLLITAYAPPNEVSNEKNLAQSKCVV